jgi:capsular exopolysaccharide synthesis family protein
MRDGTWKDFYELLDVGPGATGKEIEDAYRRARAAYDAGPVAAARHGAPGEKTTFLSRVTEAYQTLMDPKRKKAYDMGLDGNGNGNGAGPLKSEGKDAPDIATKGGHHDDMECKTVRLKEPLMVMKEDYSMVAEQYRILFTKIEEAGRGDSRKTFAVTSSIKGEGKSITTLNLAYLAATEFKKRTLLVECDLRKPSSVSGYLDEAPRRGTTDVLRGGCDLRSALVRVEGTGLYLLAAGDVTGRTSELLSSPGLSGLMEALKAGFDYVFVDSPPVLPLVDMNIISRHVDGVLFVIRAGKTPKDIVLKALGTLQGSGVIGMVLNGSDANLKRYYY